MFGRKQWEIGYRLNEELPTSLYPVIHKDTNPLTMDHSELIIYNASLNTSILKDDSRKVANIIIPLVMDTDAFEWGGIKITQIKER